MLAQTHHHFPKAAIASAFLVLAAVIGLTGTGRTAADPATAPAPDAPAELVWVRQDDPVINVNNDPTFWEAPEGDRFEGSFWEYIVDETAIIYEERYVDHGYEWYNIMLRSEFDRPPLVINPPLRYKITARAGHSATKAEGAYGVGFQFWYDSDFATVEPREVLAYYPWSPNFTGQNSKEWMVSAPPPQEPGQTFEVWASWWNCPPCNVTWTYKAEPATAVEELGVEVVQPVVTYQGEEVPPGEIFFPETCALPDGRGVTACSNTVTMGGRAENKWACYSAGHSKTVALLKHLKDLLDLSPEQALLVYYLAEIKLADGCGTKRMAIDDTEFELVVVQGGMLMDNVADGQIIRLHTTLGSAMASKTGAFAAGYDPQRKTAVFEAFSAPLVIEAKSGGSLTLPPAHKVELTAAGFGPVTPLPQIFLPVQMRW